MMPIFDRGYHIEEHRGSAQAVVEGGFDQLVIDYYADLLGERPVVAKIKLYVINYLHVLS